MKTFLLTAGYSYYPCLGEGDWKETFETLEEAQGAVEYKEGRYGDKYLIDGQEYDWYRIIDLNDWING